MKEFCDIDIELDDASTADRLTEEVPDEWLSVTPRIPTSLNMPRFEENINSKPHSSKELNGYESVCSFRNEEIIERGV